MCDIQGSDEQLEIGNPSQYLIYSDWKILPETEKHYVWPLGIWKMSVEKDSGGGESCISVGAAVLRRMLLACFRYLIKIPPPSLVLMLRLLYVCVIWIKQIRISCSCVASLSESSCFVNALFLILFFVLKLQLPHVCVIPLLHACPFSHHIVVFYFHHSPASACGTAWMLMPWSWSKNMWASVSLD